MDTKDYILQLILIEFLNKHHQGSAFLLSKIQITTIIRKMQNNVTLNFHFTCWYLWDNSDRTKSSSWVENSLGVRILKGHRPLTDIWDSLDWITSKIKFAKRTKKIVN